jgi:hypothetical protein
MGGGYFHKPLCWMIETHYYEPDQQITYLKTMYWIASVKWWIGWEDTSFAYDAHEDMTMKCYQLLGQKKILANKYK